MGKCGWYFVPAWNKLYKRKLFDKLRYPVGKQHEDEFLIHHLIYRCKYITCIEDSLYYYVQRQGSIMSQKTKIKMMDYGEALLDRYYFAKAKKNDILKEWAVKQLVYEMGKWESYACSDKLCKKKYLELKKKTYPILFDKTLWSNYSMFGRIITKLQLVEPKLANWILSKFQK